MFSAVPMGQPGADTDCVKSIVYMNSTEKVRNQ